MANFCKRGLLLLDRRAHWEARLYSEDQLPGAPAYAAASTLAVLPAWAPVVAAVLVFLAPCLAVNGPRLVGGRRFKTVWPSGLRRWLQAPVRKGVGSNPTAVTASAAGAGALLMFSLALAGTETWPSGITPHGFAPRRTPTNAVPERRKQQSRRACGPVPDSGQRDSKKPPKLSGAEPGIGAARGDGLSHAALRRAGRRTQVTNRGVALCISVHLSARSPVACFCLRLQIATRLGVVRMPCLFAGARALATVKEQQRMAAACVERTHRTTTRLRALRSAG